MERLVVALILAATIIVGAPNVATPATAVPACHGCGLWNPVAHLDPSRFIAR